MKRTFLFSATMANEIRHIAKNYMHNPVEISVSKPNISAETVKHEFYVVNAKDRYLALKRVADINPNIYGIVFCRTRQETKEVAEKLIQDGYNADALHGDLSQAQRDHVMNRFRIKNLQILVATDVAARGLDVDNLTHIINYNLPDELESYIHRSGRTGRAGKTGVSISIIHSRQTGKIRDLERMTSKKFVKKPVPGGIEICEKQLFNLVDVVENVEVNDEQIEQFLPVIYKKLSWLTREDLIKHFFCRIIKTHPTLTSWKHKVTGPSVEIAKEGATEVNVATGANAEKEHQEKEVTEVNEATEATVAKEEQEKEATVVTAVNVGQESLEHKKVKEETRPKQVLHVFSSISGTNKASMQPD